MRTAQSRIRTASARQDTQHRTPGPHTITGSRWTYSETIDEPGSSIQVHGRVGRLGADLLRGTIEELHRRGHLDITVTMDDEVDVDPCARAVLDEVAAELAGRHGRLTIRWSRPDDRSS